MKVVLCHAKNDDGQFPPLGILYIAGVLREKGYEVKVYDPLPQDNSFLSEIIKYKPDLFGISMMTAQYPRAKQIVSSLRKYLPDCKFVAGGIHPTVLPAEVIKDLDLDFVVMGEGEITTLELCEYIKNKNNNYKSILGIAYKDGEKVVINPPRPPIEDLDTLPLPARDLLDFSYYLSPPGPVRGMYAKRLGSLIASRGCPYKCIFCGSSRMMFGKVRRHSTDRVIEELSYLYERYKIDAFYFLDDTFTLDPEWAVEFCEKLIKMYEKYKIRLRWACQARANPPISEELLKYLKKSGCRQIEIGAESGSDKVLRALKKGITVQNLKDTVKRIKKYGIKVLLTFMIGNPEETQEDLMKTLNLAKELNANFTRFFYLTPFPGTELYDLAIRNHWVKEIDFVNQPWDIINAEYPVMTINFSAEELRRTLSNFQNKFFIKNSLNYLLDVRFIFGLLYAMIKYYKTTFKALKCFLKHRSLEKFTADILKSYRARRYKTSAPS